MRVSTYSCVNSTTLFLECFYSLQQGIYMSSESSFTNSLNNRNENIYICIVLICHCFHLQDHNVTSSEKIKKIWWKIWSLHVYLQASGSARLRNNSWATISRERLTLSPSILMWSLKLISIELSHGTFKVHTFWSFE